MTINPQLQHRSALSDKNAILGLPLPIFAIALLITLFGSGLLISGLGLLLGLPLGIFVAIGVFYPLQHIHRHDLMAWKLWLRVLRHPSFSAHLVQKKVVYIQKKSHHPQTFQQWSSSQ